MTANAAAAAMAEVINLEGSTNCSPFAQEVMAEVLDTKSPAECLAVGARLNLIGHSSEIGANAALAFGKHRASSQAMQI